MKYPKIGALVKVAWIDAFSYRDVEEIELETKDNYRMCIHETLGEWNGTYKINVNGIEIEYADVRYSHASTAWDGIRTPITWIIDIKELKRP